MKLRRGLLVKHVDAAGYTPCTGRIIMARHATDSYIVRWTAQGQSGETKSWVQEHTRMALKPAL